MAVSGMIEQFDIFDETGASLGVASRARTHREGLWHRAANVFLFDSNGHLLIQRRQWDKDVWPGAWDLSVAEHLKPGETFKEAALRGLREELGVDGIDLETLGEVVQSRLEVAASGVKDYEFQQSFRGTFRGLISPDPGEVLETKAISLTDLAEQFAVHPNDFTPWFRERVSEHKLLNG